MLTAKDLRYIRHALSAEMLTYLSYHALEKLRPGAETQKYEYLMGLDDRLQAAAEAADEAEKTAT